MIGTNGPDGKTPPNPALASRGENSYDLTATPAPVDTVSAGEGEGEGWPWFWMLVVIAGILLTIRFIL